MGLTLSGRFREVVDLGVRISAWSIVWDQNKAIDVVEWSICGAGRLERFYCICIHMHKSAPIELPARKSGNVIHINMSSISTSKPSSNLLALLMHPSGRQAL